MKQNYDKNIIEWLFHQYFPEKEIIQYSLCDGGIENSNFLIETEENKFILKIFENSKNEMEIVESEVDVMREVRDMWSCVPDLFDAKNNSGKIIQWPEWKPVILMEFIEGSQYRDVIPEDSCFYNLWVAVANLHDSFEKITGKYKVPETHKFDFNYIIQNKDLRNIRNSLLDEELLHKVWIEIEEISEVFRGLDQQIIHDDINNSNVVFQEEGVPYLIDFSDIVMAPRIQDIAITFTQWFFAKNWYPEGVRHYLKWYQSIRGLSDDEKNCLFICVKIRMLNIMLIPYLDVWYGKPSDFMEMMSQYMNYLRRFDEFGKYNFMKLIP